MRARTGYVWPRMRTVGAPVDDLAAEGFLGLEADEQDGRIGPGDVPDEVLFDAAARAHPRAGHDDARAPDGVDGLGFLARPDELQAREIEGPLPDPEKALGLVVQAFQVALEDPGHVHGHGAVEEYQDGRDAVLVAEPAEMEHQLLGPFDGERGDDDVAPGGDGLRDDVAQQALHVLRVVVVPVAVGRLHDDVIGPRKDRRVPDEGLVPLADVAGKDDGPGVRAVRRPGPRSWTIPGCGPRRGRRRKGRPRSFRVRP